LQVNHANTWCMEGDLLEDQSRLPAAWKSNRQCLERTRALLEKSQSRQLIVLGAHATERVAGSATSIGRFEEALAAYDEEDRFLAELLKAEPTNPQFRRNVAIVAQGRAGVYCSDDHPSLDQPEPCLRYANQYLEHARQLSAGDAGNLSARTSVAIALSRVSWIQHFLDPATSVRLGRESIKIFDELIAGGNKGWFLATRRARTLRRLVESLLANHQNREALAAANEALAAQRVISARNPKDAAEAGFLVRALLMAAKASDAMRNPAKAGEFFTEAESVASAAWSRNRDDLPTMKQLSDTRLALGDWFRSRQDPARSRDWYVRAAALWREFPDRNAYVAKKTAEVEQLIPKDSLNSN
jgi:tetratricopeptide (TPR) repeat protein